MQPLQRSQLTRPNQPALPKPRAASGAPVVPNEAAGYLEGQSELVLLRGPVVLRGVIVAALIAVFLADLNAQSRALDITALYAVVIVLSVLLWSLRWVVGVTLASMLLNVIGLRVHLMGTAPGVPTQLSAHLAVMVAAQLATGALSYQMIVTQRRYERVQHTALRRQRDLYHRERASREALQQAREDAERQAAALAATLQREREARERAVQARDERERLRRLTEDFQRALLPKIPPTAARGQLMLGGLYQPAIAEMEIGGDFYDVLSLDGDRVGLVIGDVAGHGVEAAARTAIAGNTLLAYAVERAASPARAIERLNRTLTEQSYFEGFVSLFYGVYDPATHTLTYVNAGHEPPVLLRRCRVAEELGSTGMVAGVNPDATYSETQVVMAPGDCLLLLTDGLTEARSGPGVQMLGWHGAARLAERECARTCARVADGDETAARAMAEEIFAGACRYSARGADCEPGGLRDDLALMVVCVAK